MDEEEVCSATLSDPTCFRLAEDLTCLLRNVDSLDLVSVSFASPSATKLQVTLAVHDLAAPPPPANFPSGIWAVYWTSNGTEYFAKAESTGSGSAATWEMSRRP
jgi:hypothetical protein